MSLLVYLCDALASVCAAACQCSTALQCAACLPACLPTCLLAFHVCLPACLSTCLSASLSLCPSVCLPASLSACLSACLSICLSICHVQNFQSTRQDLSKQVICVVYAGAYTAKRYSLWQSRQAVLNAQLTGPTGGSSNQLDTETAAADAIAALGKHIVFKETRSSQKNEKTKEDFAFWRQT